MAQVALIGHVHPKTQRVKDRDQRPRRGEHVVGPVQSAELADRGMLQAKNSAVAQR